MAKLTYKIEIWLSTERELELPLTLEALQEELYNSPETTGQAAPIVSMAAKEWYKENLK